MNEFKNPFVKINLDANYRDLKPGDYIDAVNLMMPNQGADVSVRRESVEGNRALTLVLPEGDNKCVGAAWDKNLDEVVFINQNSNGNHGLYSIDLSSNSVSLLQSLSGLDEDLMSVEGLDFLGDFIFWTDNSNRPYYHKRGLSLNDTSQSSLSFSIQKPSPTQRLEVARVAQNSNVPENFVAGKPFQFAYRYYFKDKTVSTLSPFSEMVHPVIFPDKLTSLSAIRVRFNSDSALFTGLLQVEKVEYFYRIGENGEWVLFSREGAVNYVTPTGHPGGAPYDVFFTGTEGKGSLPDVESDLLTFDVPMSSKSLVVVKNILLLAYNNQGYDDFGNPSIALTKTEGTGVGSTREFIPRGRHKIGVVFYDKFMRPSFVKAFSHIDIGDCAINKSALNGVVNHEISTRTISVNWSMTGNPPAWASSYQMFMTPDLIVQEYVMCPVNVYFYLRENKDGVPVGANEVLLNEKIYFKVLPTPTGLEPKLFYEYIDLLVPANLGYIIDTNCYVRFVGSSMNDVKNHYYKVLDFSNNFIRIDRLEVKANTGSTLDYDFVGERNVLIEIVRFKETEETIYYAAGDVMPIVSNAFSQTSGELFGFEHKLTQRRSEDASYYLQESKQDEFNSGGIQHYRAADLTGISQTSSCKTSVPPSEYQDHFTDNFFKYTPDRSLISKNYGRPNIENEDESSESRDSTISYSSPFIQSSNKNFINQFLPANKEILALNRGPIQKIVATDEDVALILHSRTCTSVYVQEGFIRFSDGAGPLTKTDEVIGQERKSQSNYGTVNPESVAILLNKIESEAGTSAKVYWWDQYEGAVCRHSNNGIIPISDYGMKDYFRKKSNSMVGFSNLKIIGGCHPYWDAYLITFPAYGDNQSETWVFSEELNAWIGRIKMPMVPDRYISSGSNFFSFLNGVPYIHDNSVHANFFGQQQECSITFVANTLESFEKVWAYVKMISSTNQVRIDFSNDRGQETHTLPGEYRLRDNKYYSDIRRDVNTNSDTLEAWQVARLHGDRMISDMATVKLSFTGGAKWALNEVTIGFKARRSNG